MSGFTKDFEKDDGAVWDLVLCIKTKLFRKLSWNIFPLSQNSSAITTLLLQICKTNQSKLKTWFSEMSQANCILYNKKYIYANVCKGCLSLYLILYPPLSDLI